MTQKKILLLISLILLSTISLSAQSFLAPYKSKDTKAVIEKIKTATGKIEKLRVAMDIDINELKIKSQQMLILTPQIISQDKMETEFLPLVILAGNSRLKVIRREINFGHIAQAYNPLNKLYRAKDFRKNGTIRYVAEIDYKPWMKNSSLALAESVEGCASCIQPSTGGLTSLLLLKGEPYIPKFASSYVAPEVEAVKNRAEHIEAFFNYRLSRYELLKDYKGNRAELQRVDKFIKMLTSDQDLKVSDFKIEGFASPEGIPSKNLTLSTNRANTFAAYLKSEYNISNSKMKVKGMGEDWDGLRKSVASSSIEAKDAVLDIIDHNTDLLARKAKLKALNGGTTYRYLLDEYYPPLRRNTLTVSFVVKGFSLDEALKAYRTHPNRLSLEEYFRLSQTFTKGSEDFIKVFQTALKYFPNSEIALLNSGAALIDANQFIEAKTLLSKAGSSAEVLSNLGIIAFNEGNMALSKQYFEQAIQKGSEAAKANMVELQKYIDSI